MSARSSDDSTDVVTSDRADAMRSRFLTGLAAQVGLAPDTVAAPGVSVVGRDDRAGTGIAACYRVGAHLVVWADPAVVAALPSASVLRGHGGGQAPDDDALADVLGRAGFDTVTGGVVCTLRSWPAPAAALPSPYHHRRLSAASPDDVQSIRTFIEGSDPAEAELAGLADFGDFRDFDEVAINVVVDGPSDGAPIVSYASAMDWEWDPVFADIAVLVSDSHRGLGLARFVTAATVTDLLLTGRLPLYRYRADNVGSARLAAALGFGPVTTFSRHRLR